MQAKLEGIKQISAKAIFHETTHIGLIGSGASAIYLLHNILIDLQKNGRIPNLKISVFEKSSVLGGGMPYNPQMVDTVHVVNILPEETPDLLCPYVDWLQSRSDQELLQLGIQDRSKISDKDIYSRFAMYSYLHSQYEEIIKKLKGLGVTINQHNNCTITDAVNQSTENITIIDDKGKSHQVNRLVIATGHSWLEKDKLDHNFYSSPWPIHKMLPKGEEKYNFRIGLLGASLSAFDVVTSLAERHGQFIRQNDKLEYIPYEGTENFHLVLHSSQGKLPHIRCGFQWPHVVQHRFFTREDVEQMAKSNGGKLQIETYFQKLCKPQLVAALRKDGLDHLADQLNKPSVTFTGFIEIMNSARLYSNPFEGMKLELEEAHKSIETQTPIHWKETLDDLMYTLNHHSPLLSGEDLLFYQHTVIPFLLNVTAFLPLVSSEKLLALYEAGKVSLASGRVQVLEKQPKPHELQISRMDPLKGEQVESYQMFVDCTGQKTVNLEDFPFPKLAKQGVVREATAMFTSEKEALSYQTRFPKQILKTPTGYVYLPGGIEIDNSFHVIGRDGKTHKEIYDIAYPHLKGQRPFFPGLQQCHDTGKILAEEIMSSFRDELRARAQIRVHHSASALNRGLFGGKELPATPSAHLKARSSSSLRTV